MKKWKLLVALVVVLSLLVAASVPISAGKGKPKEPKPKKTRSEGNGGEKKPKKIKTPPEKPVPPGQAKKTPPEKPVPPGQAKKDPVVVEPPEATPEPEETEAATVLICHKPGTPAQETLALPPSAIPGHLRHGDTLGACDDLTVTPTIEPTETPTVTVTVIFLFFLYSPRVTLSPGLTSAIRVESSSPFFTRLPLTSTMMSYRSRPACSAGEFFSTLDIMTPPLG